ncbi:hypothetical protein J6590_099365 [Homalodisca vitripennis]|nr:hypothetical protein J6590_099365 [Homalodisca vitripennis]
MPMAEWSKTLDFGSELDIAQVQILSVIEALFVALYLDQIIRPESSDFTIALFQKMRRGTTGNADIDLLSSVPLSLVRV